MHLHLRWLEHTLSSLAQCLYVAICKQWPKRPAIAVLERLHPLSLDQEWLSLWFHWQGCLQCTLTEDHVSIVFHAKRNSNKNYKQHMQKNVKRNISTYDRCFMNLPDRAIFTRNWKCSFLVDFFFSFFYYCVYIYASKARIIWHLN